MFSFCCFNSNPKEDEEPNYFNHTYENTKKFSLSGLECYARVVKVYDGDTITVVMKVFGDVYKFSVRISGIDACEMTSKNPEEKAKAIKARNRILQMLNCIDSVDKVLTNKDILHMLNIKVYIVKVKCFDFDKYGRLLADVFINEKNIGEVLLNDKLAYKYDGGTKLKEII